MIPICAFSHVFASARGAICIGLRKHFRGTMQAYFSVTALRLQLQLSEKDTKSDSSDSWQLQNGLSDWTDWREAYINIFVTFSFISSFPKKQTVSCQNCQICCNCNRNAVTGPLVFAGYSLTDFHAHPFQIHCRMEEMMYLCTVNIKRDEGRWKRLYSNFTSRCW